MGAIFFYVFIYFIAYYSTYAVNLLSARPLISNRYIAGLVPVFLVATSHAYFIFNSAPPPGMSVTSALMSNIVAPIVIVIIGALYFMWKKKNDALEELEREEIARKEALEDDEDYDDDDLDEDDKDTDDELVDDDKASSDKSSDNEDLSDDRNAKDKSKDA